MGFCFLSADSTSAVEREEIPRSAIGKADICFPSLLVGAALMRGISFSGGLPTSGQRRRPYGLLSLRRSLTLP